MLLRILLQPVGGADAMSLLQCPFFSEQKTSLMKKNAPVLDVVSNILVQLYNKQKKNDVQVLFVKMFFKRQIVPLPVS